MSVGGGSQNRWKRGRVAGSRKLAMGEGEVQVGRERFLAGPGDVRENLPRERRWQAKQGTSNRPRERALAGLRMDGGRRFEVEVRKGEGQGGAVVRKIGD